MAVVAYTSKSQAGLDRDAREQRQKEALERLEDARRQKSSVNSDHQNAYYYTAPRRVRQQQSNAQQTVADKTKPGDDRQLQTSFGMEVADEFISMLIETFTPREGFWAERRMPTNPDEDGQEDPEIEDINKAIKAEDKKVFDLIRSSNYYAEKAKAGKPDAAIGVVALLVTDPGRGQPVNVLGVPIRELDMDLGPDGKPDFRSITRPTKYRHLAAQLGREVYAKLEAMEEFAGKTKDQSDKSCEIVWAWWRNWENFGDVEWRHVVLVDHKLVHEATMTGEGSCALIVGRFGATPDFAWPDGPLLQSLPDLVSLDETRAALIENLDFTLRPPKAFEDDGLLNIPADGVRPGELYPKRPNGGKPSFEDIYEPRPIDAGLFEVDHLQMRIRRLHYVDFPEQKGKTPPTATQWIDELVIRQRRIGAPGFAFWREEPYETFQRFRYLGERRGTVMSALALGVPGNVALQPYNPAERAQDSQDISTAIRFAEIGQLIAPTMWQVMLEEAATLKNLKAKFRDEIVVLRSEAEAEERIRMLTALAEQALGAGIGQQRRGGTEE
jgi:hypothetical protein